jgi:hypothetical protein
MMVSKVDFKGRVVVLFSHDMVDTSKGFNLSSINNSTVNITVISAMNGEILRMNWTVISYINKQLELQLWFENPLLVSSHSSEIQQLDEVLFIAMDKQLFKAETEDGALFLKEEKSYIRGNIAKQLKNDTASIVLRENAETIKSSMNSVMIGQVFMNLLVSASLSYVIGAFHVLQIICFMTMMNLNYPGNA